MALQGTVLRIQLGFKGLDTTAMSGLRGVMVCDGQFVLVGFLVGLREKRVGGDASESESREYRV